ncbi:cytidylyltransferase domain-containing protein [Desulfosarcina ovata]|uniref:CMP-N,N'-diacetyllegionaminic acid synthase n=1 Tax=Desulfosarcina ovata subsp. ovata TaxID=2752305 RepID=A0A5K8A786_9BACT|nr:acylneuraminate cytidylyltransferase family protein [Desulfosarcina ovata]BBO88339.1 CMP-N,N'-diacetyllegionaminic acid synthase [Desulfosarcina ovata subsp. ovata]
MKTFETLAIIPARGGSKGLPRKNILDLGGKPLIAWSIEAALSCPNITRVMVSTDDQEIADVSKAYGADVPFLRPPKLATDSTLLDHVLEHTLRTLEDVENYSPDILVEMYPTSPFRSQEMVRHVIEKVEKGYRRALTVRPIVVNRIGLLQMDADGRVCAHAPMNRPTGRTSTFYRFYGLVMAFNRHASFCRHPVYLYKVDSPLHLIDIDTPEDLRLARRLLEKMPQEAAK